VRRFVIRESRKRHLWGLAANRLVVLVAGHKIADGPPQEAIRNPEVEKAYLGE